MENIEPQAAAKRRKLPLWVYVVSFTVLIGFLVLIGKQLMNTSSGPIAIGQKVPEITLTTFDGALISSEDLAGKVVVLNFWASWCKPCEQEAAELEQAWQMYKDSGQVVFLGVDWTDTEPEARAYLEKFNISYPNGPDLRTRLGDLFRITGVPETYFINPEGELAYVKKGPFLSLQEIQTVLDSMIQ